MLERGPVQVQNLIMHYRTYKSLSTRCAYINLLKCHNPAGGGPILVECGCLALFFCQGFYYTATCFFSLLPRQSSLLLSYGMIRVLGSVILRSSAPPHIVYRLLSLKALNPRREGFPTAQMHTDFLASFLYGLFAAPLGKLT